MSTEMQPVVQIKSSSAIVTPDGEIIALTLGPITAEEAATRLPVIQDTLKALRRFEDFLSQCVSDDMIAKGQTERRSGAFVYELKPDAEWVVSDDERLFNVLLGARNAGEVTDKEFYDAAKEQQVFKFDHRRLAVLAKRLPVIDTLRRRVEGATRLRIKR
jgi:hypothetical protein